MKEFKEYFKKVLAGRIFNSALFYLAWLVTLDQAKNGHPYLGPLLIAFLLGVHLWYSNCRKREALLIFTIAVFGTLLDSNYIWFDILSFKGGYESFPWIIPLWMSALWAFYATSINHSLAWLNGNLLLQVAFGSIGGAMSYLVAIKLGAATLLVPEWDAIFIIGFVWGIVLPASFALNNALKDKLRCCSTDISGSL